jgi:hypothetical protein
LDLGLYSLLPFNLIDLGIRGFTTSSFLFKNPVGRPRKNPIPPFNPSAPHTVVPYGVYSQGFALGNGSLLHVYKLISIPSSYIMQVLTGLILSEGYLRLRTSSSQSIRPGRGGTNANFSFSQN